MVNRERVKKMAPYANEIYCQKLPKLSIWPWRDKLLFAETKMLDAFIGKQTYYSSFFLLTTLYDCCFLGVLINNLFGHVHQPLNFWCSFTSCNIMLINNLFHLLINNHCSIWINCHITKYQFLTIDLCLSTDKKGCWST